jgi:hypothetical protein
MKLPLIPYRTIIFNFEKKEGSISRATTLLLSIRQKESPQNLKMQRLVPLQIRKQSCNTIRLIPFLTY